MKSEELKIGADGNILNNGIHDASIIEAKVSGEGRNVQLTIKLKSEQSEYFNLSVDGVKFLNINFFGTQNIVADIFIFNKVDAMFELKKIIDLEKYTFEKYDSLNALIKKGDLVLVKIIPSVGGDFAIVGHKASLSKTHS